MVELLQKHKKYLLFLFFVSFIVRAAVFYFYLSREQRYWQVDSQTYHLVATQLAQGKGVVSTDGSPHFYRLPGYPLFLATYYIIFGADSKNVLWLQVLVSSMIPFLIFLLSCTMFPTLIGVAKIASLYSVVHLGLVLYASFFMSETLFIFFFLLFLLFFFKATHLFFCRSEKLLSHDKQIAACPSLPSVPDYLAHGFGYFYFHENIDQLYYNRYKTTLIAGRPEMKQLLWAGLFLGMASLVRPVGHYVVIVALFLLLLTHDGWRKKLSKNFILLLAWIFPISFWLMRNFLLTGYLFFHTLPGGHFLYLSAARVAMHVKQCSYQEARQFLYREVHAEMHKKEQQLGRPLLEIESCKIHEQVALKYFKNYPGLAVKNWYTDMVRTMFSLYTAELMYLESGRQAVDYFKKGRSWWDMFSRYLNPQQAPSWLKLLVWLEIFVFFLLLLGLVGFFITALIDRGHSLCVGLQSLFFIGLFIMLALSGGYARMRLPIEPLMIIMASYFVVISVRKVRLL